MEEEIKDQMIDLHNLDNQEFVLIEKDIENLWENNEKYLQNLKSSMSNLNSKIINLIFLGEASAGKATILNTVIAWGFQNKTISQDDFGILPISQEENTSFLE